MKGRSGGGPLEGLEREAKFAVPHGADFPALAVAGAIVTEPRRERLETVYWDTADGLLAGAARSLRHRGGEGWTAKRELGAEALVLTRSEERFGGPADAPPAGALGFLDAGSRAAEFGPVVRLRVERVRRDLLAEADGAHLIEAIDDDVTVLDAGGREAGRFRELELELMDPGGEEALRVLVARIAAADLGIEEPMPKYDRALALLEAGTGA